MVKAVVSSVAPDGVGSTGLSQSEVDARVVAVAGNALKTICVWTDAIANNGVWVYPLGATIFTGSLIINGHTGANRGTFGFRSASTAHFNAISATAISTTTGILTGTTGGEGAVLASVHTNNNLYIQNRTGSPLNFSVAIQSPFLP